MHWILILRCRWALKILQRLRNDQATGPDHLPAAILRRCSDQLATPIITLARICLRDSKWPKLQKFNWISPLHKKKSMHDSGNYRGLHLTTVLSKVVERVVAYVLVPFFIRTGAFGNTQWAFPPTMRCTDLVAVQILRWLQAIQSGKKTAVLLSDISITFDRGHTERLLTKLKRCGLNDVLLNFFADFLNPRDAVVLVDGCASDFFVFSNMVFQGTVFKVFLWNIIFKDISATLESHVSICLFSRQY